MAPSAMPCASAASSDPPANAMSQRFRSLGVRQRNSKATPRKIRPSSMAMIGRVERRHQHRIGQRKRRHQAAAAQHQPGLVAVPDRRHAVHDHVAVGLVGKQRKQDAEAEIEPVHHHIDEDREGDDEGPDGGDVDAARSSRGPFRGDAGCGRDAGGAGRLCRAVPVRPDAAAAPSAAGYRSRRRRTPTK